MSPDTRARRDQQRRARAQDAARRAAEAQRRRTRLVAAVVAALVVLGVVAGALAIALGGDEGTGSATSTTAAGPTTSGVPTPGDYPASGTRAVPVEPGAALTGPTPCPAEDGSSARTTTFAEPPPLCIDPGRFHTAVVTTTAGTLTFQLNPQRALQSTNAFVVLARYHFYDGQPLSRIEPRAWFEAGGLFADGQAGGFPIPDENPPQGQIFTPGTIAMVGTPGTPGSNRGELLVATLDQAPRITDEVTSFGIMLDGAGTLAAIDRAASQDGLPTEVITIQSVTVTPGAAIG